MSLLNNGYRHNLTGKIVGVTKLDGANPFVCHGKWHRTAAGRNILNGLTDNLASVPNGATHPVAWILADKAGGMSAYLTGFLDISATANGVMGFPIVGSAELSVFFADATGSLITSGEGSASISLTTNTPLLTASINGEGSATISITADPALLGAIASGEGSATFAITGSLTPYAIGHMEGSALPYTELSPQSLAAALWDSAAVDYSTPGTMGEKINTSGSGGLTPAQEAQLSSASQAASQLSVDAIPAAILIAASSSPIAANIREVNSVAINGTGTEASPWGP